MCSVLPQVLAKVEKGSSALELRDYNGRSLVLTATREGHADVVELLLAHGADCATPNNDGWTPLAFACRGEPKEKQHPPAWAVRAQHAFARPPVGAAPRANRHRRRTTEMRLECRRCRT